MSSYLTSRPFVWVAVLAFVMLAAAVAVIQNRPGKDGVILVPLTPGQADPLFSGLVRCRTVMSDDTAGLDACRRIWAGNRQRFFGPATSSQLPAHGAPDVPAGLVPNGQDQSPPHEIDQGRTR